MYSGSKGQLISVCDVAVSGKLQVNVWKTEGVSFGKSFPPLHGLRGLSRSKVLGLALQDPQDVRQ